jgi:antitoxin ParD1/3/4
MQAMATLQLSLPDTLKSAAQAQAAAAGCESVDDYIAGLIEADRLPPIDGALEQSLLDGLDSGPAVPLTRELIEDVKRTARGDGHGQD